MSCRVLVARRRLWIAICAWLCLPIGIGHADPVPISLQSQLLRQILLMQRDQARSNEGCISVLITKTAGNSESEHNATQLLSNFESLAPLNGKAICGAIYSLQDTADFIRIVSSNNVRAVYFTESGANIAKYAKALAPLPVISLAVDSSAVEIGVLISFRLISSKPKIIINESLKYSPLHFAPQLLQVAQVVANRESEATPFVIIVNRKNQQTTLSITDLKSIFIGKQSTWADGQRIQLVLSKEDTPAMLALSSALGVTSKILNVKIAQEVFKGQMNRPEILADDKAITTRVESDASCLGLLAMPPASGNVRRIQVVP